MKEKKKWGLIFFMVFIMIGTSFSFIFFGFANIVERIKYDGFTFTNNGNVWLAKINGRQAGFSFLPKDVENIPTSSNIPNILQSKLEIDATYDLNSTYKESFALALHQMVQGLPNCIFPTHNKIRCKNCPTKVSH